MDSRDVLVGAQVADVGEVAARRGLEDLRLAAVDLARRLEEEPGIGIEPRDGDARSRRARPRRRGGSATRAGGRRRAARGCARCSPCRTRRASCRPSAGSRPGSVGNVMKPSSTPDLLGTEGEEEVGARVGVDDRLERQLRLRASRATARRLPGVLPIDADEVADRGDVGVEDLRGRRAAAVDGQRRSAPPSPAAPGGHRGRGRRSLWCRRGGCRCFGHGLRRSFGRHRAEPRLVAPAVSAAAAGASAGAVTTAGADAGAGAALSFSSAASRDSIAAMRPEYSCRSASSDARSAAISSAVRAGLRPGRRRARRQRCRCSGCLRRVRASRPSPLGRSGEHHSRRKRARDYPRAQPALPPTPRRTHGSLAIETTAAGRLRRGAVRAARTRRERPGRTAIRPAGERAGSGAGRSARGQRRAEPRRRAERRGPAPATAATTTTGGSEKGERRDARRPELEQAGVAVRLEAHTVVRVDVPRLDGGEAQGHHETRRPAFSRTCLTEHSSGALCRPSNRALTGSGRGPYCCRALEPLP